MIENILYILLTTGSILLILSLFITQIVKRLILLISIFFITSFLFIILNYYYIGLTYIIIYIGAITILFLFVIMMIDLHPINT